MEVTTLQFIWFFLIGLIFGIYAILDGFDLGVGLWFLFTKSEEERTVMKNSVGPVWDGNEVWLIAGAGGLLAAFPLAYGTLFSSVYLAAMLLLWAIILRAVSFEFRDQFASKVWKKVWDAIFFLASFLITLLLGVALGNVLNGLILDSSHNYTGTFFDLLNPFAVLVGLLVVVMVMTHGASYLIARTESTLQEKAKIWFNYSWIVLILLFILLNIVMIIFQGQLLKNYNENIIFWIFPVLTLIGMGAMKFFNQKEQYFFSFVSSASTIFSMILLVGIAIYPNLIPAITTGNSVSISAAANSETTLTILLIVALIGVPIILIYTFWFYRVFIIKKISQTEHY